MSGTLFLVATPIGNLGDISLRALETLRRVSSVVAEDTRRTRALLSHFEITGKTVITCNAHAREASITAIVLRLERGEDVAFVTDAGTPSVSDPGASLVRAAARAGIAVSPIPGVSAVTAAVAVSGMVEGPFSFLGFPPRQGGKRREFLDRVARAREPVVLFEGPHRVGRLLSDLAQRIPDRGAVLCRELTKLYEDIRRGTLAELAKLEEAWRGEVTLVIAAGDDSPAEEDEEEDEVELDARIERLLAAGTSARDVVDVLAGELASSRRDIYRRVTEISRRLATSAERAR